MEIGPEVLERRADQVLIDRLEKLGRTSCDVLIFQNLSSSEIKMGWPLHRMQQIRDRGLSKWNAIEVSSPLEAEWIAGNAPVHAIVAPYSAQDMSIRYRAFQAAINAGVAIVSRASNQEALSLQLGTPEIVATMTDIESNLNPMSASEIETRWNEFQKSNPEPAKLRSGHPPEYGS